MRFIPTKIHGILDYLMGLLLIFSPWVFGFENVKMAMYVPVVLGVAALIYSMLTNYELGISRVISMRAHLMIDLLSGLLLAASPWIFGFSNEVYLPHLILGLVEIMASLMTQTRPGTDYSMHRGLHDA